jgi:hypothetical protein
MVLDLDLDHVETGIQISAETNLASVRSATSRHQIQIQTTGVEVGRLVL